MSEEKTTKVDETSTWLHIEFRAVSGDLEPWTPTGDGPPRDSIGRQAPEKVWVAYTAYLNSRGEGEYRLTRVSSTTTTRTEVL